MTSELKVDKISPATGTSTTLGDSGDTFTVPSGVTLDTSSSTLSLPSSVITGQTEKTTLVDADKFLISDSAASGALKYVQKSNLGGGGAMTLLSMIDADQGSSTSIEFQQVFSSDYDHYRVLGCFNIGSLSSQDMRFRWLNSSNTEQTVAQYYGCASGFKQNNSSNGSFDFGAYGDSFSTIGSQVYGGAYYRKITLDMTLFPDAYASNTYSNIQWQIGYYHYNSGSGEQVAFANGMNSYTQTADLSGGGIKLYLSANSWDFVTCGLYGIKTVT